MKNLILILIIPIVFFIGCKSDVSVGKKDSIVLLQKNASQLHSDSIDNSPDINDTSPDSWVLDNNKRPLIIYKKLLMNHQELVFWNYWVTDGSGSGWRLVTNKNYNVGDTLKISK